MPPQPKPARLYLRRYSQPGRRPIWAIRFRGRDVFTGATEHEVERAEQALREFGGSGSAVDGRAKVAPRPGFIYFFSCDLPDFPIKIGFARDVGRRKWDLQSALPYELRLLGSMPGTSQTELDLHQLFAGSCLRGEWFARTPDLMAFIADLGPSTDTPPDTVNGPWPWAGDKR